MPASGSDAASILTAGRQRAITKPDFGGFT